MLHFGMASREVGIRDLRNHTSRVLDAVNAGETVYLTNRGHRVAEIRPVAPSRPIDTLVAKARRISRGDTGWQDELLATKEAEIEAAATKEESLWG